MKRCGFKISVVSTVAFVLSSFAVLMAGNALAQIPAPDSTDIQREIVRRAYERFGMRWGSGSGISIDRNGILLGIGGPEINIGLTAADPVERAYQFFERHQDLLQIQNPQQELVYRGAFPPPSTARRIRFDQIVNGVEVYGGRYYVYFLADSSGAHFDEISGRYYPEARNINTIPTITKEQAIQIALSDTAHTGVPPEIYPNRANVHPRIELIIEIINEMPHLVWPIPVYVGGPTYYIDAHSGEVLRAINETIID